ncbi:hypothetical protein [Hyphomicrobium sp. ghe19]|uniref:hypothetical protein n=1 Tax=Hyphomicrobium sp. ghe19 TaxID=2682968 RepID=UPI001367339C|nr:hypothetical protein HYPP_01472 [Hyphomicrobium sp. ghe19]
MTDNIKMFAAGIGSFAEGELERREFVGVRQPNGDKRLVCGTPEWEAVNKWRDAVEAEIVARLQPSKDAEITALRSQLSTIRTETIEMCAKVAESNRSLWQEFADRAIAEGRLDDHGPYAYQADACDAVAKSIRALSQGEK